MTTNPQKESDVALEEAVGEQVKRPRKYAVILHNDHYTTMDFVIDVLSRFFRKSQEEAMAVMLEVHHKGHGVAGVYSSDIAETKAKQVVDYAREHGYPLRCTVEPET